MHQICSQSLLEPERLMLFFFCFHSTSQYFSVVLCLARLTSSVHKLGKEPFMNLNCFSFLSNGSVGAVTSSLVASLTRLLLDSYHVAAKVNSC